MVLLISSARAVHGSIRAMLSLNTVCFDWLRQSLISCRVALAEASLSISLGVTRLEGILLPNRSISLRLASSVVIFSLSGSSSTNTATCSSRWSICFLSMRGNVKKLRSFLAPIGLTQWLITSKRLFPSTWGEYRISRLRMVKSSKCIRESAYRR